MRFLAGVGATVHAQIILRDEALAADVTHMWLLAGVLALMHRQIRLAGHDFAAYLAHVFVLRLCGSAMSLHVHQQHLFSGETLAAHLAVVLALRRHVVRLMELRVQSQTLTVAKRGAAIVALVRLVRRVRQQMHLTVTLTLKLFAAHFAFVLVRGERF